jgi:hypothetical protein
MRDVGGKNLVMRKVDLAIDVVEDFLRRAGTDDILRVRAIASDADGEIILLAIRVVLAAPNRVADQVPVSRDDRCGAVEADQGGDLVGEPDSHGVDRQIPPDSPRHASPSKNQLPLARAFGEVVL